MDTIQPEALTMVEAVIRPVTFSEIDWSDSTCLVTFGPIPKKLYLSIKTVGLIQKPVLQGKTNGTFRIVCGSRRLAIWRELGLGRVSCQLLPSSIPTRTCLLLAIHDNLAQRPLNPVEKSLVIVKMGTYASREQLTRELLPLLDLEPGAVLLEKYERLQRLEPVILEAVAAGRLHERSAFALWPLPAADRLALFQLFQDLPFSVSLQEEIVELVVEVAQRDGLTAGELVGAGEIRRLRGCQHRPARQRAQEIRKYLQARRFPRLTARRQRFAEEVRKLGLPPGVRLLPPPYFEGPQWRLEFTFEHAEEVAGRLHQTAQLAMDPEFQRVMHSDIPGPQAEGPGNIFRDGSRSQE